MLITTQNSLLQKYQAKVISFEVLQDWKFKVSYYDDEGVLTIEVVDHKRLDGEFVTETDNYLHANG
jgi:hypothetical protein